MLKKSDHKLAKCVIETNCFFDEWKFKDINKAFNELVKISLSIPRTTVVEETNNYWHGICRSLIFRFPDDLEILKSTELSLIQVKSSSRYGASDLGVNRRRINGLYKELMKKNVNNKL
ncbi:DUF1499 domain-containing protein [Prochlorococcus sp. MIT 1223]|uniref:DUF1499 domain-containing protein n=1 Tax=Prochlorococcus sp. MIT 1223 TaxID=3096217 RepID=UPI002A759D09|nr:DUF1499 domain-containing protein [Prochlorococcus sp. MIT 1223]